MSKFEIRKSSPAALAGEHFQNRDIYPFDDLNVGQSFFIPLTETTEAALRVIASRKNKQYADAKRFSVIKTTKDGAIYFEVARIV